jgi:hypothetical protein
MSIMQTIRTTTLIIILCTPGPAMAEQSDYVGKVEKTKNEVTATLSGTDPARPLNAGNPVYRNEMVKTGAQARAELRLADETSLALGENAQVRLDEFVYDKDGSAIINLVTGALRFISGAKGHPGKLTIKTPVATIGVRGTDFWAGPIDGVYGVLLLTGKVEVSNSGGSVTLDTPRTGTLIIGADVAPGDAVPWPDDRRVRALSKTDF